MSRPLRLLAGALGAAALLGLPTAVTAPAALAGDPCFHGFEMPALTVAAGTKVAAKPCAFVPTVITVPAGGNVTFLNGNGPVHLVTGANQAWGDREVRLEPNASVTYTFEEPGIYPYACALHPGMSGAVVVGDGGAAVAAAVGSVRDASGTPTSGDEEAGDAAVAPGADPAHVAVGLLLAAGAIAGLAMVLRRRRVVAIQPEPLAR